VQYHGRARSTLASGERIVLIKTDGAVLVHRPTGYEPVNWQPSDCRFRTRLENESLIIDAVRNDPHESLSVHFERVSVVMTARLSDAGEFSLHVSEKEMQQAVIAEPKLLLPDFKPISYEKQVEPGFIDVYGLDSEGRLVIVELKRVSAGKAAAIQLSKYVEYVKTMTQKEIRGILAAPGLLRGTQKLLATLGLEFVHVDLERCARVVSSRREIKIVDFFT
jgi:RecB family endonuclease NucS